MVKMLNFTRKNRDFLLLFVRYSFIMKVTVGKGGRCAVGELIAVLSGKGGTGKTSVTAGLATALAESGAKVLCIDCDVGLRNLDISLGISQLGALSFLDVCSGNYDLDQATAHPLFPGLKFLTAPMNCDASQVEKSEFTELLRKARERFQYVLLDAPAGVDAGFRLAACYADRVLLVTGADPAAVRDAARASDLLELMGKRDVRLVVNRVNKKMVTAIKTNIDDIMDKAGLPLIGVVPEDSNVTLAAAMETPLLKYTKRGAAAACRRIAKRIQGLSVPIDL